MADKYLKAEAGSLTEVTAISASAGATDAGKIAALNSSGVIDTTMLPPGTVEMLVTNPTGSALAVGDGQGFFLVPASFNGKTIKSVHAGLTTASSSGTPTVQVARIRGGTPVDVLSTKVTIDASELTSYTAATPPVVDTANDDLATGDLLRVDVDVAGTGAKGLMVLIERS